MTSPIIDFIEARVEEDRALAQASIDDVNGEDCWFDTGNAHIADHYQRHDPARVLREVAAKRAMVDAHGDNGKGECETCLNSESDLYGEDREAFPCWHLKTIAAVYSDYPDYREEWKP